MDTKLWWRDSFSESRIPEWSCPSCLKGLLELLPERFFSSETAESIASRKDPEFDREWVEYTFSGVLKCSNVRCGEHVSFGGNGKHETLDMFDEQRKKYVFEEYTSYSPKFFFPSLRLFPVIKQCPVEVAEEISASFALYWSDTNSCANKIRVSVEAILNNQGLPARSPNGRFIPLAQRLVDFEKIHAELARMLMAIKFIGNDGSHPGEVVHRQDVISAYELIEHVILRLYDDNAARLQQLGNQILARYTNP